MLSFIVVEFSGWLRELIVLGWLPGSALLDWVSSLSCLIWFYLCLLHIVCNYFFCGFQLLYWVLEFSSPFLRHLLLFSLHLCLAIIVVSGSHVISFVCSVSGLPLMGIQLSFAVQRPPSISLDLLFPFRCTLSYPWCHCHSFNRWSILSLDMLHCLFRHLRRSFYVVIGVSRCWCLVFSNS